MIVRIVKMTFRPEEIPVFLEVFKERQERIRNFDGCRHLELWKQEGTDNVYFTYSHWDSEQALNHYRFSEFFKDTWSRLKVLFAEKAQAWSVQQVAILP